MSVSAINNGVKLRENHSIRPSKAIFGTTYGKTAFFVYAYLKTAEDGYQMELIMCGMKKRSF